MLDDDVVKRCGRIGMTREHLAASPGGEAPGRAGRSRLPPGNRRLLETRTASAHGRRKRGATVMAARQGSHLTPDLCRVVDRGPLENYRTERKRAVQPHPWSRGDDPGQAMLDVVLATAQAERVGGAQRDAPLGVARGKGRTGCRFGQHRVDLVGHGGDQRGEEGRRGDPRGFVDQLDEGEFAGPVDADKEKQVAVGRLHRKRCGGPT